MINGIDRNRITFEPFEVMGYDAEFDTWGVYGIEIYIDGKYAGKIGWVKIEEVESMSDEEIEELINNVV